MYKHRLNLSLCISLLVVIASCSRQSTEPDLPIDPATLQLAEEYVGTIETTVERPDTDRISQQRMPAFSKTDSLSFWFYPDKGAWFCEAKRWYVTGTDGAGSRYWLRNGKIEFQAAFFSRYTKTAYRNEAPYNSEVPRGFYTMLQDGQGRLVLEQRAGEEPTFLRRRQRIVLTKVVRAPMQIATIDYLQPDSAAYTGLVEAFVDSAFKNINTGNDIVYGYTQRSQITVWFDPQTQAWTCRGRGWLGSIGIATYKVEGQFIRFNPILLSPSIPGLEVPISRNHYKRINGDMLLMEQFPGENAYDTGYERLWQRFTLKRQNSK